MTKNNKKSGKKSANLRYSVPTKHTRGGLTAGKKIVAHQSEKVCALTNPFCPAARGTKIPDDDSAPSIPASFYSTFEVVTDANGDAAFSVGPSLNNHFRVASSVTGTTPTWGAYSQIKDWGSVVNAFDQVRIVSMGVRVYSVAAPTSQSGYCRIITTPESLSSGVNLDGGLWDSVETYPVSELDAHVILKPQGVEWKVYAPLANDLNYNYVNGIIKGGPASATAFIVETVMHLECLVNVGSVVGSLSTPGRDSDTHLLAAASRVHGSHKGTHNGSTESVGAKIMSFAKNALLDVAASAIPFIGNSVAGLFRPRQRMLPYAPNVD